MCPMVRYGHCKECKWFDQFNAHGYCHRYAPTPLNHERGDTWSYPVVPLDGWCGDFERGSLSISPKLET